MKHLVGEERRLGCILSVTGRQQKASSRNVTLSDVYFNVIMVAE